MKFWRLWSDTLFGRIFLLIGALLLMSQFAVYWYFTIYLGNPQARHLAQSWAQILTLSSALDVGEAEWLAPRLAKIGIAFYPVDEMSGNPPHNPIMRNAQRLLHDMGWPHAQVLEDSRHHLLWIDPDPHSHVAVAMPIPKPPPGPSPQWFKLSAILLLSLLGAYLIVHQITGPLRRLVHSLKANRSREGPVVLPIEGPEDIKHLAGELNSALRERYELAEEREMVLLGVSHDLRTPLTRMRMLAEFLPKEAADIQQDLIDNLWEMDETLHQFLDYARSGREELAEEIDLLAFLRQFAAQQGDDVLLREEVAQESLYLSVTPVALRRVLQNLVENARRHGKAPIELAVMTENNGVAIEVRDHGEGISAENLAMLGKPFALAGRGGGTGLGIAIVQRILQRLGGSIQFNNAADSGLRVRLFLPLHSS
ncbi:ATP-binding protein [Acidithiobacillus sp. IBUN Pt1247-S3]|uniref:ATP-binding protein n=1 Tax=Acidithiobacillus sp. IBUN Pt1247-S3 TaxID=3166642 RepID=UPI0034E3D4C2